MTRLVDYDVLLRKLTKLGLGTREVSSDIFLRGKYRYVTLKCKLCGRVADTEIHSLLKKMSRGCICTRNRKYDPGEAALVLQERYSALQQRCENPRSQSWARYGGRGIQNKFANPQAFVDYMLEHCPHQTYRGVEIDRKNNEGHYEPGNLRLVPREINQRNKRSIRWVRYKQELLPAIEAAKALVAEYPTCTLNVLKVAKKLRDGMSWKELANAKGRGPYRQKFCSGRPTETLMADTSR